MPPSDTPITIATFERAYRVAVCLADNTGVSQAVVREANNHHRIIAASIAKNPIITIHAAGEYRAQA